ncbi:hypothetical protein ACLOJK_000776 [Asimina triloba]
MTRYNNKGSIGCDFDQWMMALQSYRLLLLPYGPSVWPNMKSMLCELSSTSLPMSRSATKNYPLIVSNDHFFFLIVDVSLAYNAIIGQVVDRFQAAIFTYHLYLKFPTLYPVHDYIIEKNKNNQRIVMGVPDIVGSDIHEGKGDTLLMMLSRSIEVDLSSIGLLLAHGGVVDYGPTVDDLDNLQRPSVSVSWLDVEVGDDFC